jgi:hypothetical protein
MKTNHMQNSSATEDYQWIAASGGVKKLEPKEGRTKQVGDVRLIWKATGEDTGYATSFYEMDLPPGKGIPIHSHPYAEVFYVVHAPQANASSGLEVLRALEKRNRTAALTRAPAPLWAN